VPPPLEETVELLRAEIADLYASRARLVAAADADRRTFERSLHDGIQQELVALLVNLQLARGLCETDSAAASALLEEIGRDARIALEGLRQLALEIYPPVLDAGGLVVALRSVAADAGIVASVEAELPLDCRPELAAAAYFCCAAALRSASGKASVWIRPEDEALVFELAAKAIQPEALRGVTDRIGALGGRVEIEGARLRGTLPLR